ncbi:hypothetical protein [Sulfurospirillum multivorans]|uniref:PD-(D/E)XK endonuclease-like domain-containing protein n=2 Tax=Sulfurospirillum multivorans TaxID=66821 RepID=A0AA86AM84_SULMK|nr:hypothetical protein [Sulfurospirillum multivorans]AHJ13089.1 hypothetical protein SMUL_1834 [Sulfurospirillum multivorans DSM 12446]QEH06577.1 hypothetical protein SMN_1812 [Sulfurospirillum multivorans]
MSSTTPFYDLIEEGIRNADSGLGDRSTYVGASDIGQCLKKSYLSKFDKEDFDFEQLLIFERGHVAEGIFIKGLENSPKKDAFTFTKQVEFVGKDQWSFLRAHLDLHVNFPQEDVAVEGKTFRTALPDDKPRLSWVYQNHIQMWLANESTGRKTRGVIAAIDLNTAKRHEFPVVFSEILLHQAQQRGLKLWNAIQSRTEPEGEVSDLCGSCKYKSSCSTLLHNAEKLPDEIDSMLTKLKELSAAEKEAKALRENIKAFMEAANIKKGIGTKYNAIMYENSGKSSISLDLLKKKYPEVANAVSKDGKPFLSLRVV